MRTTAEFQDGQGKLRSKLSSLLKVDRKSDRRRVKALRVPWTTEAKGKPRKLSGSWPGPAVLTTGGNGGPKGFEKEDIYM